MNVTQESTTPTTFILTVAADGAELETMRQTVVTRLAKNVKLQGFRPGKAPMAMVEKSLDQNQLQTEFLEQAVNDLYIKAIDDQRLRPAIQPEINITKFVPFSVLEFKATVEAVGAITLGAYKKLALTRAVAAVTEQQIDDVITDLQTRAATRTLVERAAKTGDEVVIDFAGTDPDSHEPIANTDGTDFALELGSGNFIPGFEEQLIGAKAGATKTFDITFPKDYGVADMQSKKVTFAVTVQKVQEITLPKLDADFAATVGAFKTVDALKKDIRRELESQQDREIDRDYENALLEKIAAASKVAIPTALVDDELERIEQQERQNVVYRGQTWQEHLEAEGITEDEHKEKNRQPAELRVRSGLILGEIAEAERIKVTPEELEIRIQLLKGQYASDERMQAELDKPENRRDILSRLMTEKTLDTLKSLQ